MGAHCRQDTCPQSQVQGEAGSTREGAPQGLKLGSALSASRELQPSPQRGSATAGGGLGEGSRERDGRLGTASWWGGSWHLGGTVRTCVDGTE